jgi:hypothetical protein
MSPRKTQKLRTFVKLDKKPVAQKGIQYSFETVGVVSSTPGLKGDIVKKYVNGKLKEQKFVTREKLRELVRSASKKQVKRIVGGKKTQKGIPTKPINVIKPLPAVPKNKNVNVQIDSNANNLLAEQKKKEMDLLERQVVAQENMVKAADTGNNLDKGFLGLLGIAVGIELFDK